MNTMYSPWGNNGKWRFWLLLLIIHCTVSISASLAQRISGTVVDSLSRKPLMEASVSLLLARDSSLVTFGITDGDGRFVFPKIAAGQYRVLVTYVGYKSRARRVSVTSEKPDADAGAIDLVSQSQTLTEVSVQGEKAPIAVKGDTLEFNADSFKTRPNAQVEDLLKKLPGVEVDRDGNIKAQGQSVQKVLVDGKPFFGNDPKMATRNLPADIIDKVQLFDQSSEQSAFSGVDDGDREKTINITTKKDKRKGSFGQQTIGAGPKLATGPRIGCPLLGPGEPEPIQQRSADFDAGHGQQHQPAGIYCPGPGPWQQLWWGRAGTGRW